MFLRITLPILLFCGWSYFCQQWYVCKIKQKCGDSVTTVAANANPDTPAPAIADNRPIVFNFSQSNPQTRSSWITYRDSLIAALPDDAILEIVGLYAESEATSADFPNMGMARAAGVQDLFKEVLPTEKMLLVSRLTRLPVDAQNKPFESVNFNYLIQKEEEEAEIVELDDRTIIQFPFSSAQKEPDAKVDTYLNKLTKRLKQTEESVQIIGHTDDIGDADLNVRLGRARARHIKNILIEKGIPKSRIIIDSKGESMPVATNKTEEGRRKNRRAEINLIEREN